MAEAKPRAKSWLLDQSVKREFCDLSTIPTTMSRLASLQSTPKRSRSSPSPSPSPAPSPLRATESTHHRMLKLVLAEVKVVLSTWDDILLIDGLKAGKACIDEGTEME